MPTPQKNDIIEDLTKLFKSAHGIYLTDYSGLSVDMMTDLRKRCHAQRVGFRVVKNTLADRAAQAAGLPDVSEWFQGSTAVAYAEDPAQPIKLLQAFVREVREANGKPQIKKGIVDGRILDDSEIDTLARLPAPEIVKARLLGLLQAPASRFVGILSAAPAALVRVLDQRRQQSESESSPAQAGPTDG